MNDEFEKLEREAIAPWAFLLTSKGLDLTAPNGKRWSYKGVAFSGSVKDAFWNSFIDPYIRDITSRIFDQVRELCEKRSFDLRQTMIEADGLLRRNVARVFHRMVTIDRRLRGGGSPNSVPEYAPEHVLMRVSQIVSKRLACEIPD